MNSEQPAGRGGTFVVLDGTEGCGKSTQSRLLQDRLVAAGIDAILVRDPGATRIGEQLRGILLNPDNAEMGMRCEMLLYMAARAQMMAEIILPALAAGRTVISDRFVSSTLAYQLGGEGLTAADIRAVAGVAISGRWPDLTILLDMPVEKGLARVGRPRDRIEQRPMEYHGRVRSHFLALAEADPSRYRIVPADQTPQEISEAIWQMVQGLVRRTDV